MITRVVLTSFKNFAHAELTLRPLTVLVGTNASGKSNVRDALRFLHGISRGYTLAEIIGEKWVEGGVLQWRGIRGGTREVGFAGSTTFAIEVVLSMEDGDQMREATYRIEVDVSDAARGPKVVQERLVVAGRGQYVFDSHPDSSPPSDTDAMHLAVRLRKRQRKGFVGPQMSFINSSPVLAQVADHPDVTPTVRDHSRLALAALRSMRFLDLDSGAMKSPSLPGQTILGDRGENLSSVLQAIAQDPGREAVLTEWIRELTPMDAQGFTFPEDQTGRILVTLVEGSGQKISAHSASDGTLRFLAMIAAILGPEPADLYFFEELENGIHPNRLHLLLELIERKVNEGTTQLVATSHSPQLLALLSPSAREGASLVYRLDGQDRSEITPILSLPDAARVFDEHDLARLHAAGWFEDAAEFSQLELDLL